MSTPSRNLTVKLELDIAADGVHQLHAAIQLEGDADIVARASAAVTTAVTGALPAPTPTLPTSMPAPTPPPMLESTPMPRPIPKVAPVPAPTPPLPPTASTATSAAAPLNNSHRQSDMQMILAQRDWSKFSLLFGALLIVAALLVAVIFPPIVPPAQRLEVFMMSLAFGLLGTLALYSGSLPGKGAAKPGVIAAARTPQPPQANRQVLARQRAAFLRTRSKPTVGPSLWGMAFGAVFVVAGAIAPFALDTGNADERFLMMLGFAPVVAVGVLLIAIFWRRMQKPTSAPSGARPNPTGAPVRPPRAPVARAPNDVVFKFGVSAALLALGMVLLLVIGLVAVATLAPMLR